MILVVGGAGYIGSHMCKLLREAGERHLVFDNLENGHEEALQGSPFVKGDLRNPEDLRQVLHDNPIDVVMHFAAYISVGASVREPGKYYDNNFTGVLNLLEAMRHAGVFKFIFSSTAAIFGEPEYVPIDEKHPKNPKSPYGDSKYAVERALDSYEEAYGLKSVCLRYFNAAGADPEGVLGEDHAPEEHLIPLIMHAAQGRRPEIKIFGTDYDTPDGTCIRDYIHILDLASAHLLAVRHLRDGGESKRYNLGNGLGYSVREVIQMVEKVVGRPVPQSEAPRRPGDPARLIASSELITRELGWKSEYADLETIVRHAWRWFEAHPHGYRTTFSESRSL
jgi:UDP-glucose 4-epimerase